MTDRAPGVLAVSDSLRYQAERAIASVVEGGCPLCKVELRIHHERACCSCCGDTYSRLVGSIRW